MLVFVIFDLVLYCGVIVVSPFVDTSVICFPFWVAAEQKGG